MTEQSTGPARGQGRESILRAATELMLTERMSAVSHRSVAARAHVALGLIRYHFATRSDLLLACVTRLLEERAEAARPAIAQCSPDLDAMECARLAVAVYMGPDLTDEGLAASLGCLIDSAREDESLSHFLISQRPLIEGDLRAVLRGCGRDEELGELIARSIDGAMIAAVIDKQSGLLELAASSCAQVLTLAERASARSSR